MKSSPCVYATILVVALLALPGAFGDTLELTDGTVLENCYVRDEGTHFVVWEGLDKVGSSDYRIIPRSHAAAKHPNPKIDRPEAWDAKPQLPDLSITFIEMNPKLAGLHWRVQYEAKTNAPWLGGAPVLDKRIRELEAQGKSKFLHPEYIVQDLKLKYEPGETITFTAHVRNFGFATAQPFRYRWLIDGKEVADGRCRTSLGELDETTFEHKYAWQEGRHTIGFEIMTDQPEIATINNKATDPMWGWGYFYIVSPGRAESWHRNRTAYGTFSWEDFYRWHLDIMNNLFAESVYPSAPDGIVARVRLDRIIYLDEVTTDTINKALLADDGIGYHQGGWTWTNTEQEKKTGVFADPDRTWRNQTEWSLPHELGHQLGCVDFYAIDYGGDDVHTWPDNGEKICRLQSHPLIMMEWHGPNVFGEVNAMYLNMTWDKPRGHFGDHYFAMPDENFLRIVDVNARGVPDAKVEIFQRAVVVDTKAKPHVDHGVTWYPIVQDGNFYAPNLSQKPVIVGTTDDDGLIRLPNRDVALEVKTLNGYHRTANPFGDINVVGNRGLMLVRVTKDDRSSWFFLQAVDFNLARYAGHQDKYTVVLRTPYGSVDSPKPPVNVKWEYTDNTKKQVRVTWEPAQVRERNYIEQAIAYRIYRRVGPMALNDRPWWPVATVNPDTREFIVDLDKTMVRDVMYYRLTQRFAVSAIAQLSIESGLVQAEEIKPAAQ